MNIFANLPFEFLRKIILFSFDSTKFIYIYIYIYKYIYITFVIFPIVNENIVIKYIILY